MTDIFLSRPTWVDQSFSEGLESFIAQLRAHDLNPRTLGSSDYPTECPLDEVIDMMKQCSGAIILGYPQISITNGKIKENEIEDEVHLGTEWNHIEAALAYAMHLPMFVLHHHTVSRGIFDRGTLNSFIHKIDMADSSWSIKPEIVGAFSKWKQKVSAYTPDEESQNSKIESLFDEKTGTRIKEGTSLRYCHPCTVKDPLNEYPLTKMNEQGWECSVCHDFFMNPDYSPPQPNRGGY